MKNYNQIYQYFLDSIEKDCYGIYKQKAYLHSLQVSSIAQKLALEQGLDIEIAGITGLYHDYSQFIRHHSFQHAQISSELTQQILENFECQQDEISIIVTSIAHHSQKNQIDNVYDEILKDADVLAQYFAEPDRIFKEDYQKRLKKYLSMS